MTYIDDAQAERKQPRHSQRKTILFIALDGTARIRDPGRGGWRLASALDIAAHRSARRVTGFRSED